jgi:hypothetical protein
MEKGKKDINDIFGWLEEITVKKSHPHSFSSKSWEKWNSYMIHRWISQNPDYIDIANFTQKINPQNKQQIYSIYRDIIPKKKVWNKYIKNQNKSFKLDLVSYISQYYQCGFKDAAEYILILGKEGVGYVLEKMGIDKKEIKNLNK